MSWVAQSGEGVDYIVDIVQKGLNIVSAGVVAGKFYEFTTSPSCRGASIRKAGVCLLGIRERRTRQLVL